MTTTVHSTILSTHNSFDRCIRLDIARKARNFRDKDDNLNESDWRKRGKNKIKLHLEVLVEPGSVYDSVYEGLGN